MYTRDIPAFMRRNTGVPYCALRWLLTLVEVNNPIFIGLNEDCLLNLLKNGKLRMGKSVVVRHWIFEAVSV